MNRKKPSRFLLYLAGLAGAWRTADELAGEAGAPKEEIDPTTRAEPADVYAKWVLAAGVGVLLVVWAVVLLLYPLFTYYKYERTGGKDPAKVLAYIPPLPPRPRNESSEFKNMREFRAREERQLNGYEWVDRGKGIVSIPVERALDILARRGIQPPASGFEPQSIPSAASMETGFEGKVDPEPR